MLLRVLILLRKLLPIRVLQISQNRLTLTLVWVESHLIRILSLFLRVLKEILHRRLLLNDRLRHLLVGVQSEILLRLRLRHLLIILVPIIVIWVSSSIPVLPIILMLFLHIISISIAIISLRFLISLLLIIEPFLVLPLLKLITIVLFITLWSLWKHIRTHLILDFFILVLWGRLLEILIFLFLNTVLRPIT
jgi:hypothetical protein